MVKKKTKGRPIIKEQTSDVIYWNKKANLFYKFQKGELTREEYLKEKTELKIKLLQGRLKSDETE